MESSNVIYSEVTRRGKMLVSAVLDEVHKCNGHYGVSNDAILNYYRRIFESIFNDLQHLT